MQTDLNIVQLIDRLEFWTLVTTIPRIRPKINYVQYYTGYAVFVSVTLVASETL